MKILGRNIRGNVNHICTIQPHMIYDKSDTIMHAIHTRERVVQRNLYIYVLQPHLEKARKYEDSSVSSWRCASRLAFALVILIVVVFHGSLGQLVMLKYISGVDISSLVSLLTPEDNTSQALRHTSFSSSLLSQPDA